MTELTAEQFAQRVFEVDLLDEHELRSVWAELGSSSVPAEDFQQILLRRGLLTNYQIDRLLRGERAGFFYGDYKVLYQVGAGSFARAYRAVHKDTGQVVAIKALRRRHATDPEVTGQFCREGALGLMLRHPNIVPIYEVVSKDDTHFLVMEFLEGRTLREFLKIRKKFEPLEAVRLMCDIASGLSYAAELGITHRDLKSSNVLVTSAGQAKLVDFGLAAVASNARMGWAEPDGQNPRTIDYVGLERVTGVRKNDLRSDLFFAGCMFYHMLTGRPPLQETTNRLLRLSVARYTEIVPIAKVDPTLPDFVGRIADRAMQLDVLRRYQKPAEMLEDLRQAEVWLAEAEREERADTRTSRDPQDVAVERSRRPKRPSADPTGKARGERRRGEPRRKDRDKDRPRGERPAKPPTSQPPSGKPLPSHTPGLRSGREKFQKTVMVVESNAMMQDIFRQAFHDTGYRVLVTSDPLRALQFFDEDRGTAQGILFCAADIGEPALAAFNQFAANPYLDEIPAVLLLGKNQNDWQSQAAKSQTRLAVATPMRVRQLRHLFARLVPP